MDKHQLKHCSCCKFGRRISDDEYECDCLGDSDEVENCFSNCEDIDCKLDCLDSWQDLYMRRGKYEGFKNRNDR